MSDRLGLVFFTFAAVVSALAVWEHPSLLGGLAAAHNALLAVIYARREPARSYDRIGLWLGLLAALLPLAGPTPADISSPALLAGLLGYGLIFWSLLTLGRRFGIAPADRGLTVHGPYRCLRHPMYLGELILRAALVGAAPLTWTSAGLLLLLGGLQVARALREEHRIEGYPAYAGQVRYRLLPGVW
jgi:protein-S-isoprenylcysteine O-methyltransferase Ste14